MLKKIYLFVLSACLILSLSACGDESNGTESENVSEESEASSVTSESVIGNESAYLSAELFQFSIKIDNATYKLPAMQTAFTSNGWAVSENESETVLSLYKSDAILTKGDTSFKVQVINPTKSTLSFSECPIGRLTYDFSGTAEIYIADDFLLNDSTKSAIIEKYGEPETTETHSDFSEITYGSRKTSGNYASYLFRFDKKGKITYFSIVNHYMPD
jgi:hypothetical protein